MQHLGATHSVELFFVFGNTSLGFGPSQAEQPLVDTVMDAWGRFAHGQAPWPAWTADTDTLFSLDLPAQPPATRVKQAECDWSPSKTTTFDLLGCAEVGLRRWRRPATG